MTEPARAWQAGRVQMDMPPIVEKMYELNK